MIISMQYLNWIGIRGKGENMKGPPAPFLLTPPLPKNWRRAKRSPWSLTLTQKMKRTQVLIDNLFRGSPTLYIVLFCSRIYEFLSSFCPSCLFYILVCFSTTKCVHSKIWYPLRQCELALSRWVPKQVVARGARRNPGLSASIIWGLVLVGLKTFFIWYSLIQCQKKWYFNAS